MEEEGVYVKTRAWKEFAAWTAVYLVVLVMTTPANWPLAVVPTGVYAWMCWVTLRRS